MKAKEIWKKKGKKNQIVTIGKKKHSNKTNRSDDTNIGNNKVLCWKYSGNTRQELSERKSL
jgi:co-chaperonin GroES (HSP10)